MEDKKTDETVDGESELLKVIIDDQLDVDDKVETSAAPVRYQEGVRRSSVWWHIVTLAGLAAVIGLLVFQQFNGVVDRVVSAIVNDGNTTRVDNGAAVDKVVAAIVADGNLTRESVSDVADDVGYAQEIDGDNVRLALIEQKMLLKRFQELVVADPTSEENASPGFLNILAGLSKETRDGVRALKRSLKSHDERLANHELASQSRASALEGYLEGLSAQYGTTALGIKELRDSAERPLKVRVIIRRTKGVVVEK